LRAASGEGKEDFVIHPDMTETFKGYREGNKNAFKETSKKRDEKIGKGEICWNDIHDVEMKETAEVRSKNPRFRWPKRRKKKATRNE